MSSKSENSDQAKYEKKNKRRNLKKKFEKEIAWCTGEGRRGVPLIIMYCIVCDIRQVLPYKNLCEVCFAAKQ